MQRVVVLGSAGAGKSTFARELGAITHLPVIHLDRLYWRPGWAPTPDDEWERIQEELCTADAWILDGNYSGTFAVRLPRADTIIFLDMPVWRTLPRVWLRAIRNYGKDTQADGCPEHFSWEFTKYVAKYPWDGRPRALRRIEEHAPPGTPVHRLRSPREVRAFLRSVAA